MKLVNYKLQAQIESLSIDKPKQFFIDYINDIIEDETKLYYQRADYIGLSINELKLKIDYLAQDIRELQQLKKNLTTSLDIAKEITADVLIKRGIDRIDGNIISSLTISKSSIKTKEVVNILDTDAVMELGYVKFEPDIEAIEKAITTKNGLKELKKFINIYSKTVNTSAKVKINTKIVELE